MTNSNNGLVFDQAIVVMLAFISNAMKYNGHRYPMSINVARILMVIVVLLLFSSCKKDDPKRGEVIVGEAKIKLINASQNSSSIDFYLNDTKINSSALAYGEGSEYIKIESGTKTAKVNQEVSTDFNFMPTFSYTSFFVEDKAGKGELLTFEDNLGAVERDKSRIRFINLSPSFTRAVNISLMDGELLINALPFKESSSYFMVHAGTDIMVSIVGTEILTIAEGSEFEGGKNYTIWLSGTSNATLSINKITYN